MPAASPEDTSSIPLCIDLDGTLVQTDLLHEGVLDLLKRRPSQLPNLLGWLVRGKAHTKQRIAQLTECDVANLPYRKEVLDLISQAKQENREVVLVTAAAPEVAEAVSKHLGCFSRILSSEGTTNLAAREKAHKLVELFGEENYDYAGNDKADIPVWQYCRNAIVVSGRSSVVRACAPLGKEMLHIRDSQSKLNLVFKSLRPHQWLKNLLLFVPLFAAHKIGSQTLLLANMLAFVAFSLTASFGYIVNDLLDLQADRKHARKRNRPFASGGLSVASGVGLALLLLATAVVVSVPLSSTFGIVLALYLVLTLSYSLRLKRQVIVDVVLLAGLYTLRIIAGAAATGIDPSFWLLAFSMFIFLSLAVVKRYSELLMGGNSSSPLAGRGYMAADMAVLLALGASSGLMAVMVMALYLNSPDVLINYREPEWLWLANPLLLYWVARLWMKTHRGEVHDDPVVFAAKDWQSLVIALLLGALFFAASIAPRMA